MEQILIDEDLDFLESMGESKSSFLEDETIVILKDFQNE